MARKIEDAFEELDQMIEKLEDRETSWKTPFRFIRKESGF